MYYQKDFLKRIRQVGFMHPHAKQALPQKLSMLGVDHRHVERLLHGLGLGLVSADWYQSQQLVYVRSGNNASIKMQTQAQGSSGHERLLLERLFRRLVAVLDAKLPAPERKQVEQPRL